MKIAAVIVAGGKGTRLGALLPKAFVSLSGKSLYQHSLETFLKHPRVAEVVLVLPSKCQAPTVSHPSWSLALTGKFGIIVGGERRQDSVYNGLLALGSDVEGVLIHDAARPFVSPSLIDRLVAELKAGRNAIAAIKVSDTIKEVEGEKIIRTVNRQTLWQAQTPQAFIVSQLKEAFAVAAEQNWAEATDEAFLIEKLGGTVHVVEGDAQNLKITTPADLELAEAVLKGVGPLDHTP